VSYLFLFILSVAYAVSDEIKAEQARLRAEIRGLVEKDAWQGVEKLYQELLLLESKGIKLDAVDHLQGAVSARESGNIAATIQRLEIALELAPNMKEKSWLVSLREKTGKVKLTGALGSSDSLQMENPPFEPDLVMAIRVANNSLQETGKFSGYLPTGLYRFGENSFEVSNAIALNIQLSRASTLPPLMLAVRSGINVTRMGLGGKKNNPIPLPFTGAGPILGLKVEQAKKHWLMAAELAINAPLHPNAYLPGMEVVGLFGRRTGKGSFFAGPSYNVSYLMRYGFLNNNSPLCKKGCADFQSIQENSLIQGFITSFGGVLGYRWEKNDKFALEFQSGLRKDEYRWYSWGGASTSFRLGR